MPFPPSKRSIAREYDVSEAAIRKTIKNQEAIQKHSAVMSEETKTKKFRAFVGRFYELQDVLHLWIDSMRRANFPVSSSLVIAKTKRIGQQLSISEDELKASWQWMSRCRARRGLQKVLLHDEGAEMDKEYPKLLGTLNDLHYTIARYDSENVYNMDETELFFQLLLRYTLLMPFEDVSSI